MIGTRLDDARETVVHGPEEHPYSQATRCPYCRDQLIPALLAFLRTMPDGITPRPRP